VLQRRVLDEHLGKTSTVQAEQEVVAQSAYLNRERVVLRSVWS
jgi:hypothetical protein